MKKILLLTTMSLFFIGCADYPTTPTTTTVVLKKRGYNHGHRKYNRGYNRGFDRGYYKAKRRYKNRRYKNRRYRYSYYRMAPISDEEKVIEFLENNNIETMKAQ